MPGYVQKGMKDQQKLSTKDFEVNINHIYTLLISLGAILNF